MDPLSITAAAVGFIAVAGEASKNIRRLILTVKHAPSEIVALSNELSDLTLLVDDIEACRNEKHGVEHCTTESIDFQLAFKAHITRAREQLSRLSALVEEVFCIREGSAQYSRHRWLKRKSQASEIKNKLIEAKRNLGILLTSITAYVKQSEVWST